MKYLLLMLALAASAAQGQTAMTSFTHDVERVAPSLDAVAAYDQRDEYAQWWKDAAACAKIILPERVDKVQFYFVNYKEFVPSPLSGNRRTVTAVTYAGQEQVFVSVLHVKDRATIIHEMVHQLLYWAGEPDWHDDNRPEFVQCHVTLRELQASAR